jgi:dienelactone hydrolase
MKEHFMRSVILGMLAAMVSFAAQAGEIVSYSVNGEAFEGYKAAAKGASKGLVVIVHDWDGVDDYERKRADMLADLGYDAFAVDLFGKGNRPDTIDAKKKEKGRLYQDRARMRALLLSGLAEARKATGREKAVVMGYCFGGGGALELARSGEAKDIAGYATFHGTLATPEGQSYPKTTPPVFIAHGGADTSVPMEHVTALSKELEAAGVTYEILVYSGAPHGFTHWNTDRYQKRADELSWAAFTDFLKASFGG